MTLPPLAHQHLPYSLVGQDIRLSPERPGFESLWGNPKSSFLVPLRAPVWKRRSLLFSFLFEPQYGNAEVFFSRSSSSPSMGTPKSSFLVPLRAPVWGTPKSSFLVPLRAPVWGTPKSSFGQRTRLILSAKYQSRSVLFLVSSFVWGGTVLTCSTTLVEKVGTRATKQA